MHLLYLCIYVCTTIINHNDGDEAWGDDDDDNNDDNNDADVSIYDDRRAGWGRAQARP